MRKSQGCQVEAHRNPLQYIDVLPLYRQEAIFARYGDLPRATQAAWVIALAERIQPLINLTMMPVAVAKWRHDFSMAPTGQSKAMVTAPMIKSPNNMASSIVAASRVLVASSLLTPPESRVTSGGNLTP